MTTPASRYGLKATSLWLTNPDKSALLQLYRRHRRYRSATSAATGNLTIDIDDKKTYHSIDAFGSAPTGGSSNRLRMATRTNGKRFFERW